MNPANIFKILEMKKRFDASHPKFGMFLSACGKESIQEGTIIEISVTTPDGKSKVTNLKLNADDIALLEEIKQFKS